LSSSLAQHFFTHMVHPSVDLLHEGLWNPRKHLRALTTHTSKSVSNVLNVPVALVHLLIVGSIVSSLIKLCMRRRMIFVRGQKLFPLHGTLRYRGLHPRWRSQMGRL